MTKSENGFTYISLPLLVNSFEDSIQLVYLLHGISGTGVLPDQDKVLQHCKKQEIRQNLCDTSSLLFPVTVMSHLGSEDEPSLASGCLNSAPFTILFNLGFSPDHH